MKISEDGRTNELQILVRLKNYFSEGTRGNNMEKGINISSFFIIIRFNGYLKQTCQIVAKVCEWLLSVFALTSPWMSYMWQ